MGITSILSRLKKHKVSDIPELIKSNFRHYTSDFKYYLYNNIPFGFAPFPVSLNIKITNRCNLNCAMCGQTKLRHEEWQKGELEPSDWVDFISRVAKHKPFISLWGGEPLMYKGIIDIIDTASRNNLRVGMITNGMFLEQMAPKLACYDNIELGISLDGPPSVHDDVRGKQGVFDRLRNGFEALQYERAKLGKQRSKISVIYSTVTETNQYVMKELIETASIFSPQAMYISYLTFVTQEMINATNAIMEKELNVRFDCLEAFKADVSKYDIKHIESLTKTMLDGGFTKDFHVQFNPKINPDEIKTYYFDTRQAMGRKTCYRPWFIAEILPNGQVNFCPDFPGYRFGDIREKNFMRIWNGKEARKFRSLLKKKKLFPMCNRCCGLLTHQPKAVLKT